MAKHLKSDYYWRDPFVTESWWEEGYSKSLAHLRRGVKKKNHVFKTTPFLLLAQKKQKSPLCWSDPWSLGGSRVCFIDCLLQHEEIMEVTTIPNYKTSPPSSRFQGKKHVRASSIRTPIHHGIFLQCKEISAVQNISIPPFLLWTSSAELVVS